MNYADIKKYDVANGPGVRISLFVSGCSHFCKGCFNEIAWDYNYGKEFTDDTINEIVEFLDNPHIAGLTILGGEPMDPKNQDALVPLVKKVKELYPDKTIWCFTGYLFDKDLLENMYKENPSTRELLSRFDVMVDGEFVEDLKNLNLKFKGSSNQRTIDVQASLKEGKVVLIDKYN
ncbi:anaerobic ribonucleoside-triphosphate reductase activating protein [Lachnospiraceae bacterium RM5]|nr:anaerobic ribonucleoside-triphosphate reductase activating protein [Lachnospiraceae bacterium RM5]